MGTRVDVDDDGLQPGKCNHHRVLDRVGNLVTLGDGQVPVDGYVHLGVHGVPHPT